MKDPHEVVKAGDVVRVRVTEVDVPRKRIGLTMRKDNSAEPSRDKRPAAKQKSGSRGHSQAKPKGANTQGALGSALAQALKGQKGPAQ